MLPVTYSDNDITLWPGESQTVAVSYNASKLDNADAVDSVFGWNVPYSDAASSSSPQAQAAQQAAANEHGITSLGLADGQVASNGTPQPFQENTPAVMSQLASKVTVAEVKTGPD